MKIIAICVLRDEEDIVDFTLSTFSRQFDEVHVFDTGSVDSTWERVLALAKKHQNIYPFEKRSLLFSDALRGVLWERIRNNLQDGDWFARVDADEVYHVAPKEFIGSLVETFAGQVFCHYYDFQPIPKELPSKTLVPDFSVETRLRHYRVSPGQGEPRFFKYRSSMIWSPGEFGPRDAGLIARRKIPVRHYPARSEEQLKKRAVLRWIMRKENASAWGSPAWHHWELSAEDFLGKLGDPGLLYLKPGEEIKAVERTDHIPNSQTKLNEWWQCFVHGSGLIRLKDHLRRWRRQPSWEPSLLPQAVADRVKTEYVQISKKCHQH
jgi:hypothetical protein